MRGWILPEPLKSNTPTKTPNLALPTQKVSKTIKKKSSPVQRNGKASSRYTQITLPRDSGRERERERPQLEDLVERKDKTKCLHTLKSMNLLAYSANNFLQWTLLGLWTVCLDGFLLAPPIPILQNLSLSSLSRVNLFETGFPSVPSSTKTIVEHSPICADWLPPLLLRSFARTQDCSIIFNLQSQWCW